MLAKLKLSNKGVSPLIATILLVAVSLSLAGILYSWASQNAGDTVNSVTETSENWRNCSAINLYIENGCSYDDATETLSFVLNNYSTVAIDDNITVTVTDANNTIKSTTVAPAFIGGAMSISDTTNFKNITPPIQKVRVFVEGCPDRAASTNVCGEPD